MILKTYFFSLFLFFCSRSLAQSSTVLLKIDSIEKSNAHESGVKYLKELLSFPDINEEEKLAAQTSLVHKYQELQLWDTCLSYCQTQLTSAHQQNNPLAEATFYKLIGNTYYHITNKQKAVEYWQKSIDISEPRNYSILLEQCYHNVGVYYLETGNNIQKAEQYLLSAYKIGLQLYPKISSQINLHERLLGSLYQHLGQHEKSEKYFKNVIEHSKLLKDSSNLIESLNFYADFLMEKKDFPKAIELSKQAVAIAQKANRLDQVYVTLDTYAKILDSSGNYKEAYNVKDEIQQLMRNRFSSDLNAKISEAEAKFNNAEVQHEKELALIKSKKEKQIYLLSFIILIAAAGFLFYYFYQKRNVQQKIFMQQQVQEEKERLSRDLHDNLGSQMALLSNTIENLDINYRKENPIDVNILDVKNNSKQLLQTLRETIWILNAEQVTVQDFFDKLVDYTGRFLQNYPAIQLKIAEEISNNSIIHSNKALQLFRICQEAVTNTCKYSNSATLLLKIASDRKTISFEITDFGKGFSLDSIDLKEHYGIKNMQQRAKSIQADFKLNSIIDKGTQINITIITP